MSSNPFGDDDDGPPPRTSRYYESIRNAVAGPDAYDPALDPFVDANNKTRRPAPKPLYGSMEEMNIGFPAPTTTTTSQFARSSTPISRRGGLDDIGHNSLTSSRLSLTSNSSWNNDPLVQSSSCSIGGDGALQKEGLLCPECMVEYRTITELMEHHERQHSGGGGGSGKSAHNSSSVMSPSASFNSIFSKPLRASLSNESSFARNSLQMGDQIKGFLNKLLPKPNSIGSGGGMPFSRDQSHLSPAEMNTEADQSIGTVPPAHELRRNPIADWKLSMRPGPRRSHFEYFRKIRDHRIERYVFEANKLLIRLDRLLRDYPLLNDLARRRQHEQTVVPWIDETIVPLCPSCATKFNILTRKKHHCRLCGAVMCTKCSEFITFEFAHQLINPVSMMDDDQPGTSSFTMPVPNAANLNHNDSGKLSMKASLRSLMVNNSPLVDQENLDKLRICRDCKSLLVVRKAKMDVVHCKAPIVNLYDQLREHVQQIDRLVPVYCRMADSLNLGESSYQLQDAVDLKNKITKFGEQADMASRQIASYGLQDDSAAADASSVTAMPCRRQLSIQSSIRRSTVQYLRQNLLGLPELPDQQRLEELKQRHAEMIEKRILLEKRMALLEQRKFKQIKHSSREQQPTIHQQPIIAVDTETGFSTTNTELWQNMNDHERMAIVGEQDPMVQQMQIIRTYIRQAKNDYRFEEVAMLEENLRELEIEYYFSQQQQQVTSTGNDTNTTDSSRTTPPLPAAAISLNPFGDDDDDDDGGR